MIPEQLTEIQQKLDRAKEICEDLKDLDGKTYFSFSTYTIIKTITGSLRQRLQEGIITHGLKAYKSALEKELSEISINTQENKNDRTNNSRTSCAITESATTSTDGENAESAIRTTEAR